MAYIRITLDDSEIERYRKIAEEQGVSISRAITADLHGDMWAGSIRDGEYVDRHVLFPASLWTAVSEEAKRHGRSASREIMHVLMAKGKPAEITPDNSVSGEIIDGMRGCIRNIEAVSIIARREGTVSQEALDEAVEETRRLNGELIKAIREYRSASENAFNRIRRSIQVKIKAEPKKGWIDDVSHENNTDTQ